MIRLAVLGGSAVSTPQLAAAVAASGIDGLELALAGRSDPKLQLVAEACRRAGDGRVAVSASTELEAVLDGAALILCQVRIGGLEGRAFDERYPREFGIPGEETVGPGGFALAWRTLPVLRDLFETCRLAAPGAVLLNLTNPAGMVHRLASKHLQTVTMCDAPIVLARKVAALAGADSAAIVPGYTGLNHCGWITSLEVDGTDVLGAALAHPAELGRLTGVDADLIEAAGAIPNPYLRYLYHPERELAVQSERPSSRAEELLAFEAAALDAFAEGVDEDAVAARRPAPWYPECVVPLVRAFALGEPVRVIADVTNDGRLPFLPDEVTVEVPVEITGGTARSLPVRELPPDARAILQGVAAFDLLAADGILSGDRLTCVRGLAAHPLVRSVEVAHRLVERVEGRFGPLAGEAA